MELRAPIVRTNGICAALAGAAALAGCGGSGDAKPAPAPAATGDQRAILSTVDALETASRREDAGTICNEIFTRSLARSIRQASKHSCEAEVRDTLTSRDAQLSVGRKVDVRGTRATATIREENGNTSTVSFVKDSGRWRVEGDTPERAR